MKKRIKEKKLKQYCREHLPEKCMCGEKTEFKEKLTVIHENLGKIVLNFPYALCTTRHSMEMWSYIYLDQRGWDKLEKLKRKATKRLLLKNHNPRNHKYYSLDEVIKVTDMTENDIVKNQNSNNPKFYSLYYKGKWLYLKESVDKYLNRPDNWGHGCFKLVNYRTKADNWIKYVLLHENYDIDVEFYDGTCRRTNVLEYLQSLDKEDCLRVETIEKGRFMDPDYVDYNGIYYDHEDAMFEKEMLHKGKLIPPFEDGWETEDEYGSVWYHSVWCYYIYG